MRTGKGLGRGFAAQTLAWVAALTFAGDVLAAPPKVPAPKDFTVQGDAQAGKTVFVTYCASCHGKKGHGDGIAAKALTPPPADFSDPKRFKDVTDWELFVAVRDGGQGVQLSPLMPMWSSALKDSEQRDVVAYVKASFIDPAVKAPAPTPTTPTTPATK